MQTKNIISKHSLMQWIEDYHWMSETLKEEEKQMQLEPAAKTTTYGIDATMPKASGGVSDPVFFEVYRRTEYRTKTLRNLKEKVVEIQNRIEKVKGEREREILHRLLNGDSMKKVANSMKLSAMTISRAKEKIVEMMLSD